MKGFIITWGPVTFKLPSAGSMKSRFLTTEPKALPNPTCTHTPGFFPLDHLLPSRQTLPKWILGSPWINIFLLELILCLWRKHFTPPCLVNSYQSMKVPPRSCPLDICRFTLVRSQPVFWTDRALYTLRTPNTFWFFFKLSGTCCILLSTSNLLIFTLGGTQHALCMQLTLNKCFIELSLQFTDQTTLIIFTVRADIYQIGDIF